MSFAYLSCLLVALGGIALLDWRHKLAFFGGHAGRAGVIVGVSIAFFLVWDVVGISEGVFFRGTGPWMTGILLGPELPLEEVFFLAVLTYSTLVSYLLAGHYLSRRTTR